MNLPRWPWPTTEAEQRRKRAEKRRREAERAARAARHEGAPVWASRVAVAGVFILTLIKAAVGAWFWWERGEYQWAAATVALEFVVFAGLVIVTANIPRHWGRAIGALLLTLAAAGWSGTTTYSKLKEESAVLAFQAMEQTASYKGAVRAVESAQAAVDSWDKIDPKPTCTCPQTIQQWTEAHPKEAVRRADVLKAEQRRLDGMKPPERVDTMAAIKGWGLEIVTVFGFLCFGVRHLTNPTPQPQPQSAPAAPPAPAPVQAEQEAPPPRSRAARAAAIRDNVRPAGDGMADVYKLVLPAK